MKSYKLADKLHQYPAEKMTLPIKISFVFLMLIAVTSHAQYGTVKGVVKGDIEVLPEASITIGSRTISADSSGRFHFSGKQGYYLLTITHAGFRKIEQRVELIADSVQEFEFRMESAGLLTEIVLLGTRSVVQRSSMHSPVPVDVITSNELEKMGPESLTQKLNILIPSFNASRQIIHETVTLRGLDPDHVLIMVNGIRYHNAAFINPGVLKGELGRGSVGNDLNSIPPSSIEKIEILRDGASAQYGSDAIAGVINIQLKKSIGKTFINLHTGQQYKGDGENLSIGINRGIALAKQGFLNFSGDIRYRLPTYRGGRFVGSVYYPTPPGISPRERDSILSLDSKKGEQTGFDRSEIISNVGTTKALNTGFSVNGGYRISGKTELFWTGMANYYRIWYRGMYRFPKNPMQVNTALYPNGFKVNIPSDNLDVSVIAGIKGKTHSEWNWIFTSIYGYNLNKGNVTNTNNASQYMLGNRAPTSFYTGATFFSQQTNTLLFTKNLAKGSDKIKSFNIGIGAEWRLENYQIRAGEEGSWQNYSHDNRQAGSQGLFGYSESNAINKSRNITAGYIDLETDINHHLVFDLAGRFEYYTDFGNSIAGKLSMLYKFSDKLNLRVSFNNGFRAPALQQRYYNATMPYWVNRSGTFTQVLRGTFSNDHFVAKAFGVQELMPEKSLNFSVGLTSAISKHINLTIDAYIIQIKNRIVYSGSFDTANNKSVKQILSAVPGIDQVAFFSNAINTRTYGTDIVLKGNWNLRKTNIDITFAANFNRNRLFGTPRVSDKLPSDSLNTNVLFNIEERGKLEQAQPQSKIILSSSLTRGKFGLTIHNTRFGKTGTVFNGNDRRFDEFSSAKILTDICIRYSLKPWLTISMGVNNVFDVYPDRLRNFSNTNEGILKYNNDASPFGFNGGYYFINMAFSF